MQLIPATYECSTHHVDLTSSVLQAVEEEGPPLAFGGRERPFRVVVSCPGDGTSAVHDWTFTGKYRR